VRLTKKRLHHANDIVDCWSSYNYAPSLPFICAYVQYASGVEPTNKAAKEIAQRVERYMWESKQFCVEYCNLTKMNVFSLYGRRDCDPVFDTVSSYPWTGVSKNRGKWGPLSKDDLECFKYCLLENRDKIRR